MVIGMHTDDDMLIKLVESLDNEWLVTKHLIQNSELKHSDFDLLIVDLRNFKSDVSLSGFTWIGLGETLEHNIWATENNCSFFIMSPYQGIQLYHSIKCIETLSHERKHIHILPNGLTWNTSTDELLISGRHAGYLTPIESSILKILWSNRDTVVETGRIIKAVWGNSSYSRIDEVYVYIRSLRQKLEFNPKSPQMIRSKYRKGYVLITKNILKEFSVS